MGQTQLLFIVLAVIIVGIAVTVGITQLGESALDANLNNLTNDCSTMLSKAQSWYRKPASMGGGNNTFSGISPASIGVGTDNANGVFTLSSSSAQQVTCTAKSHTETNAAGDSLAVTITYFAANDSTAYSNNLP